MGWMQQLVETYDHVSGQGAFDEPKHPLIEAGFVEKRADVLVTLNADGTFREAERLEKGKNDTVILPTTPEAESRVVTKLPPYPLFDQLMYLAGDGYQGKDSAYYGEFLSQLTDWADEADAPAVLKTYCAYIAKGSLIHDLKAFGFAVDSDKDAKQFYCFRILTEDGSNDRIWQRPELIASWRRRSVEKRGNVQLCCVEGVHSPILEMHPKLLGNGKLISSHDTGTIFQYKGRFLEPDEAAAVSYDASVKANNTLLWLLKRQGFNRYGMQAVAWTNGGDAVELPITDQGSGMVDSTWEQEEEDEAPEGTPQPPQVTEPKTFAEYGRKVRDAMQGYRQSMTGYRQSTLDRLTILALTAATPGRISVIYYQEMSGGDYVKRLEKWYTNCAWGFTRFVGQKEDRRLWRGVGTPTPFEIASAVYGKRQADTARSDLRNEKSATKVVRELKLRLLHCMVDEAPLPRDLLMSAFHRVSAPQGFSDDNGKWQPFEWNLALSTYCALLRKAQKDENERVMDVSLDVTCTDRSYLYGRLLALVDQAEARAMGPDNYRQTNAFRYMQLFQQRPFSTWAKLHALVLPYYGKLGKGAEWYKKQIGEVMDMFQPGDLESPKALDGRYLQGYYCQRQALYTKKTDKQADVAESATDE